MDIAGRTDEGWVGESRRRQALNIRSAARRWLIRQELGVPDALLQLIKGDEAALEQGMAVDGGLTPCGP